MRSVAFAALIGSAAAFAPSTPAPRLRSPATSLSMAMDKSGRAPVVTIFDHRGCTAHANKEYTGAKANSQDDEMLVKAQSVKIEVSAATADSVLQQTISTLKRR
ncbi:phycoerythrin alpha subunit 21 [Guillardia theta CCMP2712]|uniref:Phycoerythrin alpha subunit 21 n=1 Tax=Guillardia theta (strain CCMP2712) TaxID=905079 RepID=L1IJ73_GUITC|nr:phycoerythrin alpha subunit 21 [Guillardia theta CCMP2712]EKX35979.1 phycoerythrin alpha subunit 21 [Guillardia theta CCMP2712]|eukprot:XP_005822959.1 phycoerythrin alpha subunit 21 [Guillardia theta CCMP2712]